MIPADKGTRDLLPLLKTDPQQDLWPETEFDGSPAPTGDGPPSAVPPATYAAADLPPLDEDVEGKPEAIPAMSPASAASPAPQMPETSVAEAEGIYIPVSLTVASSEPVSLTTLRPGHAAGEAHQPSGQDGSPGRESDGADGIAVHEPSDPGEAFDDAHTVKVTQRAEVEQDAKIIVEGYVGEVVARLHVDQHLMMDQDVDISFTIDGDGNFAVVLDQDMRIDQDIRVDVKIFDEGDVLYIDVFLLDSVEVEQDTTLDMRIGEGPPGGTVEVNQDLDLDQDVDIDIDIEDELEARYIVKVDVEILQEVDAEQNAVVDITDFNGEIDMDVDATQTAAIDQETIVRADFTLA
jgi:hypothetical protein